VKQVKYVGLMDLSAVLLGLVVFLGATAVCVILFQRLGFGSVLGFIVAGIIIGPHTPGPVATSEVHALQEIAELGVVLFMFVVGLEMRPQKLWAMRRQLFGLGSAQMIVTAALVCGYLTFFVDVAWQSALLVGLALAMSSTAIILSTLEERAQLSTEHGQTAFAVLMAQDLWIVPIMALVPILAHQTADTTTHPLWVKVLVVVGAIAGILAVGRYVLPALLGYCARNRKFDAFGLVLFLAILAAAWAMDLAGVSMTLGAFLMGMLLSTTDYRYQIEATVAPFKDTLMGLFFVAVGMSIDVGALLSDGAKLLVHVPVVLFLKGALLMALAVAFGISRTAAIRTGFYLSQAGEFAFVLLGATAAAGLLSANGHTLAMLLVSVTMILTPLLIKLGDYLASRLEAASSSTQEAIATDLDRHVVIIGYTEVGELIGLLLERAGIPYVAFDQDMNVVRRAKRLGKDVQFGDMLNSVTQQAAGLGRAAAACVTTSDTGRAKSLAVTLQGLYPRLKVYVRVLTLADQDEMIANGIGRASTAYIESTLVRGSALLKDLGLAEAEVDGMVKTLRDDNYAQIRAAVSEPAHAQAS